MADEGADDGRGVVFYVGLAIVGVAVLSGAAAAAGSVFGIGDPPVATAPQVSFDFERTADGLAIEHTGGATVSAADVAVVVDEEERGTWAEFAGGTDEVEIGDSIVVENVGEDPLVDLVWTGGESRTTLDRYDP